MTYPYTKAQASWQIAPLCGRRRHTWIDRELERLALEHALSEFERLG